MNNVNLVLCGKQKRDLETTRESESSHSLIFFAESTILKPIEKADKQSPPKMSILSICSCKLRFRLLNTDGLNFVFLKIGCYFLVMVYSIDCIHIMNPKGHLRLRELFQRTCRSHTCSPGSGLILSLPHLSLFLTSSAKFLTSCNPLKTYFEKFYALPQTSAASKSYAHGDSKPLHCLLLEAEGSFLWLLLTMVKRQWSNQSYWMVWD